MKLRLAQRTPTHWGLEPTSPLARLLPRVEAGDVNLVVGSGAEPAAYLLAAHDATVTFLAGELGCVNPEFWELPEGAPSFRVIARIPAD